MKKQIHVVGAVLRHEGKIFCTQRNAEKSLPLLWEFPGGKIEENETAITALKREITEELACTIEVGEAILATTYEYDFGIVHLQTFYCKLIQGTPVLLEHVAAKWVAIDQLLALDWAPADIPVIEEISRKFRLENES